MGKLIMGKYSAEDAIKKSSFQINSDSYATIKTFSESDLGMALVLAMDDCWNKKYYDELGNGFVGMPTDRTKEVAEKYPGPIAAIYRIIMQSCTVGRKAYIRNNPKLKKVIDEIDRKVSDNKPA